MTRQPAILARTVGNLAGAFIGLDTPLTPSSPILQSLRRIGAQQITAVNAVNPKRSATPYRLTGTTERLGIHELAYGRDSNGRGKSRPEPAGGHYGTSSSRRTTTGPRPSRSLRRR